MGAVEGEIRWRNQSLKHVLGGQLKVGCVSYRLREVPKTVGQSGSELLSFD